MAIEVASLVTRLSFMADGTAQVARDVQAIQSSIDLVKQAAASASPQIRKMGADLGQTVDELNRLKAEVDQASATLLGLGTSAQKAGAEVRSLAAGIEADVAATAKLQEQSDALSATYRELGRARMAASSPAEKQAIDAERAAILQKNNALKEQIRLQEQAIDQKLGRLSAIAPAAGVIEGAGRREIDLAAQQARQAEALRGKLNPQLRQHGAQLRQSTSLWKQLGTSAFNGTASLASAIGRISGLGAAAFLVVRTLMKLGQAMDQVASVSHFGPLYEQFDGLASKSGEVTSQVVAQFGKIRNSLRSEGILNADQLTKGLAGLATQIEPLTGGNLEQATSIIDAVRKGNIDAAAEIGFQTKRMAADIESMGASYTAVEAEQKRVIAFQREMARNQQFIADASQNQVKSWKDLKNSGQRLFEALGKALLPLIQPLIKFIDQVAKWVEAFAPLAPLFTGAFKAIAGFLGLIADFMERSLPMVLKGIGALHTLVPKPLIDAFKIMTGIDLKKWGESATRMAQDLEGGLGDLTYEVDKAADAWERFQNTMAAARGGTSAIDAVYQMGEAFHNLGKEASPKNSFAALKSFQSLFDTVMDGGIEKTEALRRALATPFFKEQLGEQVVLDMMKALDMTVEAMTPFQGEVDKYKRAADNAATSTQTTTGAIGSLSSQAKVATSDVTNLGGALNALPAVTNVDVVLNMKGVAGGGFSLGNLGKMAVSAFFPAAGATIGGAGLIQGGGTKPSSSPISKAYKPGWKPPTAGTTGPAGNEVGLANVASQIKKGKASVSDASQDLFKFLGGGAGGGGGGGGGSKPAGVDIEALKKFFDQVNKAILAGIRGGVSFSTAGNAIPLGGKGQFIGSQGGVLIESVNLRGVFDFADPAAKREIVRQLKEALRGFEQEI